jgi:cell division protein FtsZ
VNVDFADVKTVMSNMGRALMGTGIAKGQNRARLAAEMSIASPLLDDISVDGATGVLINIVGGPDLKMREIQEAASLVQEQAHEDANIIFGASIDESLGENVKVTVIATGFDAVDRVAREEHAQYTRQTLAPLTMQSQSAPRSSYVPSSNRVAPVIHQEPPQNVPATRRPLYSSEPRTAAAQPQSQQRPSTRERPVSFPSLDNDWDVPAFQRKQQ